MTDNPHPKTIGARAKQVRVEKGWQQQEIADQLGISLRAWQKMERDEGTPSGETLLLFMKVGVNPGWVLTGLGPKVASDPDPSIADGDAVERASGVDVVLLQRLGDTVQAVFIECKQTAPARAITEETGRLYNELLRMVPDIRDRDIVDAVIPVLRQRFKERIAHAEPGTGKRSAS